MKNSITIKILIGVITILLLIVGGSIIKQQFNKSYEKGTNDGFVFALDTILQDIQTKGYTQINLQNGSVILVQYQTPLQNTINQLEDK